MSVEPGREQLACGRGVEDALAQVADGRGADRDTHQRQCPHCQAALAEYDRLWTPIQELAAERVSPPESIVERALRRIRGAVEHSNYGVVASPNGLTRISARVVVVTARETAQTVPGVRVALSNHITGSTDDGDGVHPGAAGGTEVTAGVAGRSTAIEITLAADYGLDLVRLGERVRAEVSTRIRALTELEPVQITVIIDDVFG
ncbi:MAG: Asp23/Gls24 family envelope stress response protein [Pseudonocardiaceae bacterium]